MPWFVADETYERKVRDPESGEIGTVTMRPLAAGDRLRSIDLARMSAAAGVDMDNLEDGDELELQVPMGEVQLLAVEAAVVAWSWQPGPTRETIRRLHPDVFDQLFELVSYGTPPPVDEPGADQGDGEHGEATDNVSPLPAASSAIDEHERSSTSESREHSAAVS